MTPQTLSLRCRCGSFRGEIVEYSTASANRVWCYCADCQAFARWLGREDVLNDRGGSDIVQVAPAQLRYTVGAEHLRCMRLSPKGPFRWYADCCKQPAGNTLASARSPFVGLVTAMVERPDGASLDALLGPSAGGIWGRSAVGGCPPGVDEKASFGIIARSVKTVASTFFRGRMSPSPFVRADGGLAATPNVIALAERRALYPQGAR